jgi:hypothetical protein
MYPDVFVIVVLKPKLMAGPPTAPAGALEEPLAQPPPAPPIPIIKPLFTIVTVSPVVPPDRFRAYPPVVVEYT